MLVFPRRRLVLLPVAILALCSAGSLYAQVQDTMGTRAIGITAGFISTAGLTYRVWTPKVGVQFTLGGYLTPYSFYYTAGVAADFILLSGNVFAARWFYSQLYLFANTTHSGDGSEGDDYGTPSVPYAPHFSLALGAGTELVFFSRFSFAPEIGYSFTWNPTAARDLFHQLTAGLVFQATLTYRF